MLYLLSFRSMQNKSAEFLENQNKSASVQVTPEQIREPEQIYCDTGQGCRIIVLYALMNNVRNRCR